MSVPTKNLKAGKRISFSGMYTVQFKQITPSAGEAGKTTQVQMELRTIHGDVYEITLGLKQLQIRHLRRSLARSAYGSFPEDYHWIPKYMIKPTRWGKALFELNPAFITKLWSLVADNKRMTQLKKVGKPWQITLPL